MHVGDLPIRGWDHGESRPRLTSLSHQHGGFTHQLRVEASVWCFFFLSGFIFLLRNIRPVSVSFDDCTVLCLPIGPNIRYANVSCSLCFIFYLCFLVSNMFGFARSFDLVVCKFMRRHHPGVLQPCLRYQRGGRWSLFNAIISCKRSGCHHCKLLHG